MNTSILAAIILFVLVVILWLFMSYKGFLRMKNSASEAFEAVTLCYKARRETVGRMVKLMRSYDLKEDELLEEVMDAVDNAGKAKAPADIIVAEAEMAFAAEKMTDAAETYNEFAGSKRYIKLKDELELDDRNIATTIKIYNTIVKTYNEKVHGIMTRFAAKLCGFKDIPMI